MAYYYKVCRKTSRAMWSCAASGALKVKYTIGVRSVPPIGGLLAFRTKAEALRWAGELEPNEVLVRGRGKLCRLSRYASNFFHSIRRARKVWAGNHCNMYSFWPRGTVALAWFEPTEVI
jgi:hypothetical protein